MTQKYEMSARALEKEELENVNGGRRHFLSKEEMKLLRPKGK